MHRGYGVSLVVCETATFSFGRAGSAAAYALSTISLCGAAVKGASVFFSHSLGDEKGVVDSAATRQQVSTRKGTHGLNSTGHSTRRPDTTKRRVCTSTVPYRNIASVPYQEARQLL